VLPLVPKNKSERHRETNNGGGRTSAFVTTSSRVFRPVGVVELLRRRPITSRMLRECDTQRESVMEMGPTTYNIYRQDHQQIDKKSRLISDNRANNCSEKHSLYTRALDICSYSIISDHLKPICFFFCFFFQSVKACRCIQPQSRFTRAQLSSVNSTVCGNQTAANIAGPENILPEDDLRAFETLYCSFIGNITDEEECLCPSPCKERLYDVTVSASGPWPHPVFQQDFYTRFIRYEPFANKFQPYEDIVSAFENELISSVCISQSSLFNSNGIR
jgi:hypothetical protein